VRSISNGLSLCHADIDGGGGCDSPYYGHHILDRDTQYEKVVLADGEICGLHREDGASCWRAQRLRDHTAEERFEFHGTPDLVVPEATDLVAVVHFMCAIVRGDAWCWTQNGPTVTQSGAYGLPPRRLTDLGDLVQLEALYGLGVVCALRRGGGVVCWGGPYGDPYFASGPPERNWTSATARQVVLSAPLRWIRAFDTMFCGADDAGAAQCWGAFFKDLPVAWEEYQVPDRDRTLFVGVPVDLRTSTSDIAGNRQLACVLAGGEPRCFARDAAALADCPAGLELSHLRGP
jgi:hypothetical protein